MLVSNYTSPSDIRAALGISEDELDDATVELRLYEDRLVSDLEDISPDLDPTYSLTVVKVEADMTDAELRFLRYARLFATYSVARALTVSLPMFSPKSIEDGKAKMDRFMDPYRDTIKLVNSEFEKWKERLAAAFIALGISSGAEVKAPRRYFGIINPASNPITGT